MNIGKQLILFVFAIALLSVAGHIIPSILELKPPNLKNDIPDDYYKQKAITTDTNKVAKVDSIALIPKEKTMQEIIDSSLAILKKRKKSKSRNYETWFTAKGIALPWHILTIKDILDKHSCLLISSKEFNTQHPKIEISYTCPEQIDTTLIMICHGDSFKNNSSLISLVFELTKFDIENLAALKQLDQKGIPYSIAINPFKASKSTFYDLDKLKKPDLIISIPMEPKEYPYLNPGKEALMIHHTPQQIQATLNKAFAQVPQAVGAINYMGSRALTNGPLLKAAIKELANKGMFFIDKSKLRQSKVNEVCNNLNASCYKLTSLPQKGRIPAYLNSRLIMAKRTGQAIVLLPLTKANINAVEEILPICKDQGTKIEKLSNLFLKEN